MNICIYSNFFLPRIGGVERATVSLADGWRALGHDVVVITSTPAEGFDDRQFNFRVVRPPLHGVWKSVLPTCDVLVSNGASYQHLRHWRKAGIPFGWIHCMLMLSHKSPFAYISANVRRAITRLGDFNICVSHFMKRHIGNPNAVVIYNPVDPAFRPLPEVPRSDRYLFYGRIWKPKGMDILLRAIAEARAKGIDLPTDFVGEGPDLEATRALASQLGLDNLVRFFPAQGGETLVRTVNAAKLVVAPANWDEPFGLVAIEAMACGRCIVGTRAGGLQEILDGYAPMVPPGDPAALAEALIDLHTHPEKIAACEAQSLQRAADFQRPQLCQEYIQVFERHLRPQRLRR
jgi:glycosyltransferase involved in cell wall biosynthesis